MSIDNTFIDFINALRDTVYIFEEETGVGIIWNNSLEEISGYENDKIKRYPLTYFFPEEEHIIIDRAIKDAKEKGEGKAEVNLIVSDGGHITYEYIIAPIKGPEGQEWLCSIGRDISEKKQAENAIKESETRFKEAQNLTKMGSWELNIQTNELYWSDEIYRIFEIKSSDFTASYESFLEAIHPDDREFVNKAYTESVKNRKKYSIDHRLQMKDGRIKFVSEQCETFYDDQGNPVRSIGIVQDITERKQIEKELQNTQINYTNFINASHDPVSYWKVPEGFRADLPIEEQIEMLHQMICIDANRALIEITGFSGPTEVIGKRLTELINILGPLDELLLEFIRNDYNLNREAYYVRMDGIGVYAHSNWYGVFEDGVLTYLWTVSKDITDLKKKEMELRESRRHYRALFELAGDAIFLIKDGIFTECNQKSLDLYGCTQEQIIGHSPIKFSPPLQPDGSNSKDKALEKIKLALEGNPQFFEWKHTKYDRTPFDAEVSLSKIELENGTHLLAIVRDITKRKEAVTALRESETQFRNLANSLPQIVYEMDKEGFITYANQNAFDLLGYTQEDIDKGLNIFQLAIPEDRDKAMENLQRRLDGEDMGPQEYTALRKDGSTFPVTLHVNVITREGKYIGARGIMIDDTKRKKEEKERKILEQQLIQAQKMEAIGTLAGGVAHDFNNLLTTILGYSSLILTDLERDNPLYKDIEAIKHAGEMGSNLTHQLLAFSRKQIIQPSIMDINELLIDIEKMLRRLIGEDVEIQIITFPELWLVKADSGQMEQVIMNLVVNARDAMPKGGKLTIKTSNTDLDENFFHKHRFEGQPGAYMRLSVTDNGIGMDKETEAHIFEPFYTTKEIGKGTGLGLSTVFGIIKQNNGYMTVDTELEKGCTFDIYLPKVKGDVVSEKEDQHSVPESIGSETVLIVEDDNSVRQLAQSVLKKKGYNVLVAENGEDALQISKAHDGSIDLMITDVVMPKINGKEVAERLQSLFPHMKVIFMSGYTDDAIANHGILDSGLIFLEKPFTPEVLTKKVRETLINK